MRIVQNESEKLDEKRTVYEDGYESDNRYESDNIYDNSLHTF